ncbi:MAG TPA: peptide chain release factor N(5)-glutamine methyltransferase [Dehalococcoidia bacterium]|nr:peptide chain release factor N(5)-glutamine methyltransferase [Dehalococcoidia bacterium]
MVAPFSTTPGTTADALRRGTIALRAAGVEEPQLEAELLLRHVLGLDKTCFYLRLSEPLTERQQRAFLELLAQRRAHKPAAYIVGQRAFYDLELRVGPGVLIPRPETELVVEHCLALLRERVAAHGSARFVDVGTGSGAIALVIAKHLPAVEVLAVDQSPEALVIAGYNARLLRLSGRVRFAQSDLLDAVREPVDVVAANLPYVPTAEWEQLPPEIREHEPRAALDGGPDGLDVIRRLFAQLPGCMRPGGAAVLEIGHGQGAAVQELARELAGVPAAIEPDLAGRDRIAVLRF